MRRSRKLCAAGVVMAVLVGTAACGGGESSDVPEADVTSNAAKEFRKLVGLTDEDLKNLQGKELKIGAVLPLSGSGAVFGKDQEHGIDLAADQMREYLGIDVDFQAKDHKGGDSQAAIQAARDLASQGFGAVIASYVGVFGALIDPAQKYKMLTFDPGGGTGNSSKGEDYFWGMRANVPDDSFYALKYYADTRADAEKVALVVWDAGDGFYDPIEQNLKKRVAENGLTYTGKILSKIGNTDFSSVISTLKDMDPDIITLGTWGDDTGLFMKQYVEAGGTAQILGPEYVPSTAEVAGPAFDNYEFAQDYFPVSAPPNPYSAFFVDAYREKFDEDPATYYGANYYETAMVILQLAARVAADGGDINNGEELQAALESAPEFASVYGGDENTVGVLSLDTTTHDPTSRPVGLFSDGGTKQYAQWNIGGSDYQALD